MPHYGLPTCSLLPCYREGRNREGLTRSGALQTASVSSGRSRLPRCCCSHRRFVVSCPECLPLWGWLTCCSLVGHASSSYLGLLPQPLSFQQPPLHWGHFFPLGVPSAGFLVRLAKAGSLSRKHIRPTGTQEHWECQVVQMQPSLFLSSQGASHLQSIFRLWGMGQTLPVPMSLKLNRCDKLSKWSSGSALAIGHEVKRKHPHPLLLGEKDNVQHTLVQPAGGGRATPPQ